MTGRDDFAGEWTISRDITDRLAGQAGRFVGKAVLTPVAPQGLDYHETGILQLAQGPSLTATRHYTWAFGPDSVAVSFADGRDFHQFRPGVSGAGTDHLCGADLYRVTYEFADWPVWTAIWQVSGPGKGYVMSTRYCR